MDNKKYPATGSGQGSKNATYATTGSGQGSKNATYATQTEDRFHSRTPTVGTSTVTQPVKASPVSPAQTAMDRAKEMSDALRAKVLASNPNLQQTVTDSGTVNVTNTGSAPVDLTSTGFPAEPGSEPGVVSGGGYRQPDVPGYEAAQLTPATSQADYINAMYDANEQRQRAALETAYDANVATLDRQAATIAPQYQQAANAAAAQSAVAQAAFNERAAAAGMNTGAGSQAALAQNNTLQGNISSIRQAESEALADVEAQRASLSQQYQKAIAEAVANNEAERARALYAEAIRVDESLVSTAVNQAAENFNEWQAMYKLAKG